MDDLLFAVDLARMYYSRLKNFEIAVLRKIVYGKACLRNDVDPRRKKKLIEQSLLSGDNSALR